MKKDMKIKDPVLLQGFKNLNNAQHLIESVDLLNVMYLDNVTAKLEVTSNFCEDQPMYEISIGIPGISFDVIPLSPMNVILSSLPEIEHLLNEKKLGKMLLDKIKVQIQRGERDPAALYNLKALFDA